MWRTPTTWSCRTPKRNSKLVLFYFIILRQGLMKPGLQLLMLQRIILDFRASHLNLPQAGLGRATPCPCARGYNLGPCACSTRVLPSEINPNIYFSKTYILLWYYNLHFTQLFNKNQLCAYVVFKRQHCAGRPYIWQCFLSIHLNAPWTSFLPQKLLYAEHGQTDTKYPWLNAKLFFLWTRLQIRNESTQ